MTHTSKTIVFFGNERLISGLEHTDAPILRGLIERGYTVKAVVSHHTESRSRKQRELEVASIAAAHNIPIYLPEKPADMSDTLQFLQADAAVLVAYGRIIPQSIIDLFPLGIINIHPSLLPQYRGPTPIESAILHGDSETGVSIMQLSAGMDDGPIYAQKKLPIGQDESKLSLYKRIADISAELLFDTLPDILTDSLRPTPQKTTEITYSKLFKKSDGIIDWNKPAETLAREIRAYRDWPGSRTKLGSVDVIIRAAHTEPSELSEGEPGDYYITGPSMMIQTGSDDCLVIDAIQPLGKKEMPIQAFLAGYKSKIYP